MFDFFRRKLASAAALAALCEAAEAEARRDGQAEPGAEHFVLAALSLPDGKARRAFEAVGATGEALRSAVARQYQEPLEALGLNADAPPAPLDGEPQGAYRAAPSGRALVQALAADRRAPLTSARVLAAATDQRHGVFARALKLMGIDPERLRAAALAV